MENSDKAANSRGIHITVLHQSTGAIMTSRSFDTCIHQKESDLLVLFLSMVSQGRILCFAVKVAIQAIFIMGTQGLPV